jgi:hypothetical protein
MRVGMRDRFSRPLAWFSFPLKSIGLIFGLDFSFNQPLLASISLDLQKRVIDWAVRSSLGNQSSPKKRTFLRQLSPECSTLADIVSISQVHYGVMPALGANPL